MRSYHFVVEVTFKLIKIMGLIYSLNESSSECILDNENDRQQIYLIDSLLAVGNTKMKRGWDIP